MKSEEFRYITAEDLLSLLQNMPPETQVAISGTKLGLIFCDPPGDDGRWLMWGSATFQPDGDPYVEGYRAND